MIIVSITETKKAQPTQRSKATKTKAGEVAQIKKTNKRTQTATEG